MAYVKHTWQNGQPPAINAEHLNEMEDGIEQAINSAGKTYKVNTSITDLTVSTLDALEVGDVVNVLESANSTAKWIVGATRGSASSYKDVDLFNVKVSRSGGPEKYYLTVYRFHKNNGETTYTNSHIQYDLQNIVANQSLIGGEQDLTSIKIGYDRYKIPASGTRLYKLKLSFGSSFPEYKGIFITKGILNREIVITGESLTLIQWNSVINEINSKIVPVMINGLFDSSSSNILRSTLNASPQEITLKNLVLNGSQISPNEVVLKTADSSTDLKIYSITETEL